MKALSGEKVYVGNTESAAFEPMVVAEDVYAGDDWEDNYEERRRQTAKAVGDFDGALRGRPARGHLVTVPVSGSSSQNRLACPACATDSGIAYNLKWTGGTIDSDLNKEDQVKFKEGLEEVCGWAGLEVQQTLSVPLVLAVRSRFLADQKELPTRT
eukprot:scaffold1702_cov391-Prasinococcus_capsulatus_cf.AAC.7